MAAPDMNTKVALLERDVNQMASLFERLDSTIEKLADVSSSIKELLAVHEVKLARNEESTSNVYKIVDQRRLETEEAHRRIEAALERNKNGLKEEMETIQKNLVEEFNRLREDQNKFYDQINERVQNIEKWKWQVTGLATVGAILITQGFAVLANFLGNMLAK